MKWLNQTFDFNEEPTAEEIESYKQEWKRDGFPDMDRGLGYGRALAPGNERVTAIRAEELFWAAYLREVFLDYAGVGPSASQRCPGGAHTNQECARRLIFEDAEFARILELLNLDVSYVRQMASDPKNIRLDALDSFGLRERRDQRLPRRQI